MVLFVPILKSVNWSRRCRLEVQADFVRHGREGGYRSSVASFRCLFPQFFGESHGRASCQYTHNRETCVRHARRHTRVTLTTTQTQRDRLRESPSSPAAATRQHGTTRAPRTGTHRQHKLNSIKQKSNSCIHPPALSVVNKASLKPAYGCSLRSMSRLR